MLSEGPGCQPAPRFASSMVSVVLSGWLGGVGAKGLPPMIVTLVEPDGGPGSRVDELHSLES